MKKWVIYTALFGNYDHLKDPIVKLDEFDLICFTDQVNLKSASWKIVVIPAETHSSASNNRMYKILPHRFLDSYEISIYIDVSILIVKNPKELLLAQLKNGDAILSKHRFRDCAYEEARECVIFNKASAQSTKEQMDVYKEEGFPKNFGLYENGVLIRRHNSPVIISLMEQWWEAYNQGSRRDQLSWPYILWKNRKSFPIGMYNANDGVFFKLFPHKYEEIGPFRRAKLSLTIRIRRLYYSFFSFR